MNSSAKQILIGWIYRRIGFLKRGMKKQIKPLAAILRFLDFSIPPYRHFERSEKSSLHSALSCFLHRSIPVFCYHTYDIIPSCKKDPSTAFGMTLRKWRFPNISFIRDVGYPSPIPSFLAKSRNIPRTPLFLAPFADGFPFSAITHTALYRCARKIPRLRSG